MYIYIYIYIYIEREREREIYLSIYIINIYRYIPRYLAIYLSIIYLRELGLVTKLSIRHPLERGQHQLLVLLGDVVAAVCDDLLGLALHAQVLGGGEIGEAAQQLEDARVHVGEVAQEVEHVEQQRHLALELVVREHGLKNLGLR